jgi:hypothetical protein
MDRFRTMESFVRAGSFTIAASQLGLSRALVSRHVSDLEARLVRLLNRPTRSADRRAPPIWISRSAFREIESNERNPRTARAVGTLNRWRRTSHNASLRRGDRFAKVQPRLRVSLMLRTRLSRLAFF